MNTKDKLFKLITSINKEQIQSSDLNSVGIDAKNLSLDLKMDRANISRLLNELQKEGLLIKTQQRPTLYISRSALSSVGEEHYIPGIIPKGKLLSDYLKNTPESASSSDENDPFMEYLPYNSSSSMYEAVKSAKSALIYPPSGMNILIYGEPSSGKYPFAKKIFEYGKSRKLFSADRQLITIDCLKSDMNAENGMTFLFGNYDQKKLIPGVLEEARESILVIKNIEKMDPSISQFFYEALSEKEYYPVNSFSKKLSISCLIIALTTDETILSNPDVSLCFPTKIKMPSLEERTLQEMMVLTLSYFQIESGNISRTIRIDKEPLSCFIMSSYHGNLANLHSEIKQACSRAFSRSLENSAGPYIDIIFDDISVAVLNNIYNINERYQDLKNLYNLFESDYFYFSDGQEPPELQFLYKINSFDLMNQVSAHQETTSENSLIDQCISDIDEAYNIRLNSIRSILVRDIYDIVYPIVEDMPICSNENLLYGLLQHLMNAVRKYQAAGPEKPHYSEQASTSERNHAAAEAIINALNKHYAISLSHDEILYTEEYLYLSSQLVLRQYIQLLIISEDHSAEEISNYINSQHFKSASHFMMLKPNLPEKEMVTEICKELSEIDKGKGVVIASGLSQVQAHVHDLEKNSDTRFVLVNASSSDAILSIMNSLNSLGMTLSNFKLLNEDSDPYVPASLSMDKHVKELLNKICDKILSESLVFLNPQKAVGVLYNVFSEIIKELGIPYSDNLLIKFIFHSAFMVERCIKKQPMKYDDARKIINNHNHVYFVVDKNFELVRETFGTVIPSSEIGMIIGIFLPYLKDTSQN